MNRPHKYVNLPDGEKIKQLKKLMKTSDSERVRMRAHSILLSSEGYGVDEIARIYHADRDSVSSWIDKWEQSGVEGLYDKPRSGKPPALSESETEVVMELIKEHPHSPKIILARIFDKIGKTISISTIKRIVRKYGFRWKRMRKSIKSKRDEKEFEKAKEEIEILEKRRMMGEIDVYYYDESGFSTNSCVPYAYQPIGKTMIIEAYDRRRLNVAAFMSTDNRSESFCFECTINTEIVIACFDEFSKTLEKKLLSFWIILPYIIVTNFWKRFRNGRKTDCISSTYQNILPNSILSKSYGVL